MQMHTQQHTRTFMGETKALSGLYYIICWTFDIIMHDDNAIHHDQFGYS